MHAQAAPTRPPSGPLHAPEQARHADAHAQGDAGRKAALRLAVRPSRLALALALLLVGTSGAQALSVVASTSVSTSFRTCTTAGVSGCDTISATQQQAYGGLPGDAQATATLSDAAYGSASGSVALGSDGGPPVLQASARAVDGKRANATVIAMQSYTYTGSTTTTRSFVGHVGYTQTLTSSAFPQGIGGGLTASIQVLQLDNTTIDINPYTAPANFNMLLSGYASLPGTLLGSAGFADNQTNLAGTGSFAATVTLQPGAVFWVRVALQTPAANGSTVNSAMLSTAWDNATELVPVGGIAPAPVPEPGTALLLAAGLAAGWAGKSGLRSRRRFRAR